MLFEYNAEFRAVRVWVVFNKPLVKPDNKFDATFLTASLDKLEVLVAEPASEKSISPGASD